MQCSSWQCLLPTAARNRMYGRCPIRAVTVRRELDYKPFQSRRPSPTRRKHISVHASFDIWQTLSQLQARSCELEVILPCAS